MPDLMVSSACLEIRVSREYPQTARTECRALPDSRVQSAKYGFGIRPSL